MRCSHEDLQFRRRTLMIVVTLLAVPCAYVHFTLLPAQRRAAALERVKELGGRDYWFENRGRNLEMIVLPRSTKLEDRRAIAAAPPGVGIFSMKDDGDAIFDLDAWSESASQSK
jgi:hypothetical protein